MEPPWKAFGKVRIWFADIALAGRSFGSDVTGEPRRIVREQAPIKAKAAARSVSQLRAAVSTQGR